MMKIKQQRARSQATTELIKERDKEERRMYKTGYAIETVRHAQSLLVNSGINDNAYEIVAHELKVLSVEYDVYFSRYIDLSRSVIESLQHEISEFKKEKKEIENG